MALDWNKEISFTGKRKSSGAKGSGYPQKTYINLVASTGSSQNTKQAVPLAIVLVILVALFAKFGVFDFFDRVNAANTQLVQQENELAQMKTHLLNYDTVRDEYESYESAQLASSMDTVSATEVLDLVDDVVAPHADIASVALAGNELTLNVTNITLDSAGSLVTLLYQHPQVAHVTVSTAATQQAEEADVTTTMVISLKKE